MYYVKNKSKFLIALTILFFMSSINIYATNGKIQTDTLSLIPVRETFENLGFKVIWNQANRSVKLINEDYEIVLTRNKDEIDINNKMYEMKIIDGLSYIQLNYINDMGFEYEYIDSSNIEISKKVNIGSKVPTIKSETIEEDDLNLINENNKTKILFFWASWCPYCTEYIKEINKISNTDSLNFEIIAVNIDGNDNSQKVKEYLENNLLNAKNILDPNKEIFNYYNPKAIPTSYIIDANGIVIDLIIGPISRDDIISKINND